MVSSFKDKLSLKCIITYGAKAYVGTRKVRINLLRDTEYHMLWRTSTTMAKPKSGKIIQGGSNMTGTDLYVNKPHCAAAVPP